MIECAVHCTVACAVHAKQPMRRAMHRTVECCRVLYCARQAGELRVFSNFHVHDPYPYDIPAYCGAAVLAAAGRPTQVEFLCLRCTSLACALRTLPYAPSTSPPPSPRPR